MALTKVSSKTLSDNAVTADKIATGAITITDIPDGEITAAKLHTTAVTDKLGYTPVAPGDSPSFAGLTVDTDTLYVDSTNNRVGIGTSSPSSKLHILTSAAGGTAPNTPVVTIQHDDINAIGTGGTDGGKINFINVQRDNTAWAANKIWGRIDFYGSQPTSGTAQLGASILAAGDGGGGLTLPSYLSFYTSDGSNNGNNVERMRITSSGLVGIGTSSPSQELHVYGNNADGARIRLESTDYYTSLDMVAADGTSNVINFGDASDVNVGRIEYDHSANAMFIKTNDAERMRIDSSGNVGIGRTTGIGYRISLLGNTQATSSIQMTYTGVASATMGITSGGDVAFGLDNTSGTTERMRITSAGNVGIGTSSPDQVFHVEKSVAGGGVELLVGNSGANQSGTYSQVGLGTGGDSTGTAYFRLYRDGSGISELGGYNIQTFYTSNTERMRIDSSGNVLINTTVARASTVTPKFIISAGDSSATTIKTMPCGLAIINAFNGDSTGYGASIKMHLSGNNEVGKYAAISVYASRTFGNGTGLRFWTNPTGENGTDNTVQRMQIDHSGSIGAGGSSTNIYNASDMRLKKDVQPISSAINTINALNPVSFKWIDGFASDEHDKILYGFVAQEVQEVDTNLIENFGNSSVFLEQQNSEDLIEVDNPLRVNEKFIIPLLTKAIQELKTENDTLKSQLSGLETRIQALENQ